MFGINNEDLLTLTEEELDEVNAKTIFARDAMPVNWLEYSDELFDAAEILWEQKEYGLRVSIEWAKRDSKSQIINEPKKISSISRPYIMLVGFALENLIKGLLVAQNPSLIASGKLSKDLKSHKIIDLIKKVKNISLSEKENRACQILQKAIPYWGRYPIPLYFKEVLPETAVDDELREVVFELHQRLGYKLYQMIRDGWDSGVGASSLPLRINKYEDFGKEETDRLKRKCLIRC